MFLLSIPDNSIPFLCPSVPLSYAYHMKHPLPPMALGRQTALGALLTKVQGAYICRASLAMALSYEVAEYL